MRDKLKSYVNHFTNRIANYKKKNVLSLISEKLLLNTIGRINDYKIVLEKGFTTTENGQRMEIALRLDCIFFYTIQTFL